MTEMIEVKTADLIGKALDWAVALACDMLRSAQVMIRIEETEAYPIDARKPDKRGPRYLPQFSPSSSWEQGGPLIEKHTLSIKPHVTENGVVTSWSAGMTWPCDTMPARTGPTMLIAACRAVVMKELGSVVMVPKELMP